MSDPMNDVKAAFVLAAEHANAASAEAASNIFDAALAIHDAEVRAEHEGCYCERTGAVTEVDGVVKSLFIDGVKFAPEAEVRADERENIESAQLPMLAGILSSAGGTVRVPVAQQMLLDGAVTRMDEVDGTAVFRYLPAAARGDGAK